MLRQPSLLHGREFDLVVVGGGIVGACVAWDASLRGLSVALLDRRDFASGSSANSLKIMHGGLRHLQRLDLRSVRESVRERSTWLRLAPHLVEPLPLIVPDYGQTLENRHLLRFALLLNDVLSADRNLGLDPDRRLPRGRSLSITECLEMAPTLSRQGLRGGVLFYDAQMYSSERLVLEVVDAAARSGAVVLNYMEMEGSTPYGAGLLIDLHDAVSGDHFDVPTRFLVNATGAWLPETARALGGGIKIPRYAAALNFVLSERRGTAGLAMSTEGVRGDSRRLFIVPWRERTLVGTAHYIVESTTTPETDPEPFTDRFLEEVNRALPGDPMGRDEIKHVHFGLLPLGDSRVDASAGLLRTAELLEHAEPIISLVSVKYTGARLLAERAVDRVFSRLGRPAQPCRTGSSPLPGCPDVPIRRLIANAAAEFRDALQPDSVEHLVRSYGKHFADVLAIASESPALARRVAPDSPVIAAQLEYGARYEMAATSEDLVYRRTELGAVGSANADAESVAQDSLARNARNLLRGPL